MSYAPEHIWAVTEPDDTSADILGEVYAQQVPDGMAGKPVKYIRADLVKPKVKPLEWECFDGWTWWAKLEIVTYRVNERGGVWTTAIASGLPDIDGLIEFEGNTEEAAKAAAQADHERRIMECLICHQ